MHIAHYFFLLLKDTRNTIIRRNKCMGTTKYIIVVYFTGFRKSTQADTYQWPFHTDNKGKDMYPFDKPCL